METTRQAEEPVWPKRRPLPHQIPWWVTQGSRHFITINAQHRAEAPFLTPAVGATLLNNLLAYDDLGKWFVWVALVMPDHIHFIATFDLDSGITRSISSWKGYQTRTLKVVFQSGYFEHRLRSEAEFSEKAVYILDNPVRRGLVRDSSLWPFRYDRSPRR